MHIARLLCQMALHWECLPFLPLRYTHAAGSQRLRSFCHESAEAPVGFWKSSAREFFGAARSVLDLAAEAREAGCLTMSGLALYGIYCAKFVEVYAKAFPWMDPDYTSPEQHRDGAGGSQGNRPTSIAHRPHLSYTAEIQGINNTLRIAEQWVETLDSVASYFDTFKQDFAASVALRRPSLGEVGDDRRAARCLREGGPGEGDEEFELFRHRLCDYGKL